MFTKIDTAERQFISPHTGSEVIRVWPVEVDKSKPSISQFELTHHRVAQAGEARETISGYRVCLTLSGPVSVAWKSGGHEDRRELLAGDLCTESPGGFRWVRWDAPLDFLRLEISTSMMAELTGEKVVRKTATMIAHRGLRDANLLILMHMLRAAAMRVRARGGGRLFCEQLGRTMAAYLYERYCSGTANGRVAATCLPGRLLKDVLAHIDERIAEPVSVKDLAGRAGMSQYYFSRLFRNTVGRSPAQFVLDRRIDQAKLLMQDASLSLVEVARQTGFSSKSSFDSAFHARNGKTPSRYRRVLP